MSRSIRATATTSTRGAQLLLFLATLCALCVALSMRVGAQEHQHDHGASVQPPTTPSVPSVPSASAHTAGANAALHMEMTPLVNGDRTDSVRAANVAAALRSSLLKYRDTTAAVAAGYHMFAPNLKTQKVYHFTNNWRAVQSGFRFDPTKPTSLLYTKRADGTFVLVGAMFTAPKRFGFDKLDVRIPLSVARWHKHVNWCTPRRGAAQRWLERSNSGNPVFGPESPIATKEACDAVDGQFRENVLGWMVHANVIASSDPASIWGDEHAGHDMQEGMKGDVVHKVP